MAATPEDPADPGQPFSPSVFLDLPPTPCSQSQDDGEDLQALSDDMVLPFIRRVLMEEEDTDTGGDNLYQYYPDDHPALLQAEQPFAQILSAGSAATSSSHAIAAASSSVSGSAATNSAGTGGGTGTFTHPAFADATWPYDPDELSQLLLLSSSAGTGREFQQDDGAADQEGWGDGAVSMDMLNQAFLKGMEEANKFLPASTNSLLLLGDGEPPRGVFPSKTKPSFFQETVSRGRKNRHSCDDDDDDDTEAEAESGRRSSKLMAPEPEGSGEVADGVFLKGCEVALEKMHGLSISGGSSVPVPPPSASGEERRQRSCCNDEAVELRSLLIHCAEAVSSGNRLRAADLLRQINQRSSPTGDASQRLAHCFAQGLELRLSGSGPHQAPHQKPTLVAVDLLRAYNLHLQVSSFRMVAFMFSQMAIVKAVAGRKKVHIVDYGENHGFQWPLLLDVWATREGGPPDVRITAIGFPQPGFRPAARIHETGRRLTDLARRRGVPFSFRGIVSANWETISADDLSLEPDEVLVINGLFHFGKLKDDGVDDDDIDSPSPRDMVLRNISRMRPDVFVLCDENSSHSAPFFVTRFREALFYYAAMFDMMEATAPRDCAERALVENVFGHWVMDAIACEGSHRVQRPESYKQWQLRNTRAALRQLPLDPDTVKNLRKMVKDGYHKDFVIDVHQSWLLQGWKGRILCAMSTWVADD